MEMTTLFSLDEFKTNFLYILVYLNATERGKRTITFFDCVLGQVQRKKQNPVYTEVAQIGDWEFIKVPAQAGLRV